MTSWAIIIGIDKYWTEEACLNGAVRDALLMRKWLIDNGCVGSQEIRLLLGPRDASSIPSDINYIAPTHDNIVMTVEQIVQKSGGMGERLYFHYSGHGIRTEGDDKDADDALVPEDFTIVLAAKALSIASLEARFAATEFQEQFFFIDACRNVPWDEKFRIGHFQPAPNKTAITPQQFVFCATSPGIRAKEEGRAGDERGAFTEVLLKGLQGVALHPIQGLRLAGL